MATSDSGSKLASPPCPFCSATDSDYRFSERGYDLRACRGCNLLFIEPYGTSAQAIERVANYHYAHLDIVQPERHYESSHLTYTAWYPRIASLCATATS